MATKSIRYDRTTGDFAAHLDGQLVGYFPNYLAAETELNRIVYDALTRTSAADVADLTPEDAAVMLELTEASPPSPQPTYEEIAAVVKSVREALPADAERWRASVNRAFSELAINGWQFDGETLVIASRSNPRLWYRLAGSGCQCTAYAAGQPCWHRAARRLVVEAMDARNVGQSLKRAA